MTMHVGIQREFGAPAVSETAGQELVFADIILHVALGMQSLRRTLLRHLALLIITSNSDAATRKKLQDTRSAK